MPKVRPSRSRKVKQVDTLESKGCLVIIGGREDKTSAEKKILSKVAAITRPGRLVIATPATEHPSEVFKEYSDIFKRMGVKKVDHLFLETTEDARRRENLEIVNKARTVFFTGGDQLKITTKIGGSPLLECLTKLFMRGGNIAGTSAGAAMMGETMLLGGNNMETAESHKVGNWMMAPGLGLVHDVIIDQHFGQRGRIGRLLGAVAFNPRVLGVGIDEDTCIIVSGKSLQVIGNNAVYVIDGHDVTYTNIAESAADRTMSLHDVKVHILSDGEHFDLVERRPGLRDDRAEEVRHRISEAERTIRHH
jgi:cyanophycinase